MRTVASLLTLCLLTTLAMAQGVTVIGWTNVHTWSKDNSFYRTWDWSGPATNVTFRLFLNDLNKSITSATVITQTVSVASTTTAHRRGLGWNSIGYRTNLIQRVEVIAFEPPPDGTPPELP